jgi:hypothetical protein
MKTKDKDVGSLGNTATGVSEGPPSTAFKGLPFVHWSKDPLIPYAGCACVNCEMARGAQS